MVNKERALRFSIAKQIFQGEKISRACVSKIQELRISPSTEKDPEPIEPIEPAFLGFLDSVTTCESNIQAM